MRLLRLLGRWVRAGIAVWLDFGDRRPPEAPRPRPARDRRRRDGAAG